MLRSISVRPCQPRLELYLRDLLTAVTDQTRPRPKPTILIPFRRDPDFIERDVLHDVVHKSKEPGARIGLVGLGGVG